MVTFGNFWVTQIFQLLLYEICSIVRLSIREPRLDNFFVKSTLGHDYKKMSVLIETSVGDVVADLYLTHAPQACRNFLKLCKTRAYDGNLFFRVVQGFLAQTGDPTGTGRGGRCVLHGQGSGGASSDGRANGCDGTRFFRDEHHPKHPSQYHNVVRKP